MSQPDDDFGYDGDGAEEADEAPSYHDDGIEERDANIAESPESGSSANPSSTPSTDTLTSPYPDGFSDADLTAPVPDTSSIPTRGEIDAARAGYQFTEGEIRSGIDSQRPLLRAIGFSDDETNEYYGIQPDDGLVRRQFAASENWRGGDDMPSFEDYWTSGVWSGIGNLAPYAKQVDDALQADAGYLLTGLYGRGLNNAPSFLDALKSGYWSAATTQAGLLDKGLRPPAGVAEEDMPILQSWAYQAAQLYGDLPLEVAGFATGGMPGAFAIPAAARRAIADIYQNGTADTPKDALSIVRDAALEGYKQLIMMNALEWLDAPLNSVLGTDAMRGVGGRIGAALAKVPAQTAAMTAVFASMEQHIPSAKEFWDTMFSLAPWAGSGGFDGEGPGRLEAPEAEATPVEDHAKTSVGASTPDASAGQATQQQAASEDGDVSPVSDDVAENGPAGNEAGGDQVQTQPIGRAAPAQVFQKLFDIWSRAGVRPARVLDDAEEDPSIRDDLLSASPDIPRAYLFLSEGDDGRGDQPEAKPGQDYDSSENAAALLQEYRDFASFHPSVDPYEVGRDFLLKKNAETQGSIGQANEHLIAHDAETGEVTHHNTSDLPNRVRIGSALAARLAAPMSRIVLQHNHPNGTPLSLGDIKAFSKPGTHIIVAHGAPVDDALASISAAALTPEMRSFLSGKSFESRAKILDDVASRALEPARELLLSAQKQLKLTNREVTTIYVEVMNRALHDSGVINYASSHTVDRIPREFYDEVQTIADRGAADALKKRGLSYGQDGFDRPPIAIRPDGGLAGIFERLGSHGADAPGQADDRPRQGNDGLEGEEGEGGRGETEGRGRENLKPAQPPDKSGASKREGRPSRTKQNRNKASGSAGGAGKQSSKIKPKGKRIIRRLSAGFGRVWHHAWPMYLGGLDEQNVINLERGLHDIYHRRVQEFAPHHPSEEYYRNLSFEKKQELFEKLFETTKRFDAEFNTKLYDRMIEEMEKHQFIQRGFTW